MITVAVLEYSTGNVYIHNDVPDMEDPMDLEEYLCDGLDYHLDDIHWMVVTGDITLKLNHFTSNVRISL